MKLNLFIIGMHRSGTTFLFEQLCKNNRIHFLPVKENNFFVDDVFLKNKLSNNHRALNDINNINFTDIDNKYKYFLDASVNHFYSKFAPSRILNYNINSKIILIRRNPIERLISHYKLDFYSNYNSRSLDDSIELELKNNICGSDLGYLEMSFFKKYYQNWKNLFNKNILILDFESINNPGYLNQKLSHFLNLKITINNFNKTNQSVVPKYPNLNRVLQNKLIKNFLFSILPKNILNFYKVKFHDNDKKIFISKNIKCKLNRYFEKN